MMVEQFIGLEWLEAHDVSAEETTAQQNGFKSTR